MKRYYFFILVILGLLSSCQSSRFYFQYRAGGKESLEKKTIEESSVSSEETIHFPDEKMNTDTCRLVQRINKPSEQKTKSPGVYPQRAINAPVEEKEIPDSTFFMDESLSQAFAAPILNFTAAMLGLLTTVNPNFIWIAAPFGFACLLTALVGIICFFIALERYATNKIDPRHKKWLWIWLATFLITSAILISVALLIL